MCFSGRQENSIGGGIAIVINKKIKFKTLSLFAIWLKISTAKNINFNLPCCYRPGRVNTQTFLDNIETFLEQFGNKKMYNSRWHYWTTVYQIFQQQKKHEFINYTIDVDFSDHASILTEIKLIKVTENITN